MKPNESDRATIRRRAPRNEHGVMFELLIPGMEHAKEADFGAEMLGIAGDFEEGLGTGPNRDRFILTAKIEPDIVDIARQDHRHPIVYVCQQFIRRRGQDRARVYWCSI